MGWTEYHATHYKANGSVDRKMECDAYFMEGLNRGHFKVLKSCIKGKIYYAAVQSLKRFDGKNEAGEYVYTPIENGPVWAAIFIVETNSKDYYNFAYKDMDETMGPLYNDCPESILKLLSETDNELALAWRKACREEQKIRKNHTQKYENQP